MGAPGPGPAVLLALALVLGTPGLPALAGQEPAPANEPRRAHDELARLTEVARAPVWRALLHQSRRRIDRRTREALEAAGFFFDPDGAARPDLELIATRRAMTAATPAAEGEAQAARCRFPARHRFLYEQGLIDVPRGACPALERWRGNIGDVEATLIFPVAFLGNPSSMFGHTLLRFDPPESRTDPAEALLGWTLDFTANTGSDGGALQVVRGLSGGYSGRFGIAPYYEKIRLYSDWQDRDIWEYPLSLPPEALERVILHVWEMQGVDLPYYFFTQNCSEKLLELLEVGMPELGRGGGMPPAVTPVDSLRALARVAPGTVGTPRFRASPATRLQTELATLDRGDARLAEALAEGRVSASDDALTALPDRRRARVLTIAYDLLRHRFIAGDVDAATARARSNALLRERSRLRVPIDPPLAAERLRRTPPDQGHGTARVALSGGVEDDDGFVELRLLPAFHTALDAPGGFAEGGEIRFLDGAIRYYPKRGRVRMHELVLIDITTASPWRAPFRPLGWHAELGMRTRRVRSDATGELENRSFFRTQAGIGAAVAPAEGLLLYGFGEVVLEAAPAIDGDAAAGPLARAGLSWSTPGGRYTLRAEGIAGALIGRETTPWWRAEIEQRLTLTRSWSLFVSGRYDDAYDTDYLQGRAGLIRYF